MKAALRLLLTPILLCLAASSAPAETPAEAIARAMAAMDAAAPRAQADPAHPIFHVTAPAQWMNDPNGPIYHNHFFHLFYQLYPFSDGDGPKCWGHVRSRNLVKWERLPVALCPSAELGEAGVWSGCCTINGRGQPMIFYTSVATGQSPQTHAEQWAAIGDKDLITWQKLAGNPVLTERLHGDKKIYDWRDPFIFQEKHRTFMVTGGNLNAAQGGHAVVNIYEALDPALTNWTYRGVLFQIPGAEARTAECPNFFKLGDRWVLITSPYGKVQYFVGNFDAATCRFACQLKGILDCGPNFYAPNTMQLADGQRIVWGWVTGFPGGRGWNGCLTVPRVLSLSRDGQLRQSPAHQFRKLREKPFSWKNAALTEKPMTFALAETNTIEAVVNLTVDAGQDILLTMSGTAPSPAIPIAVKHNVFEMMDATAPLNPPPSRHPEQVQLFLDRSVLEVFVNGEICATKVIKPLDGKISLNLSATGPGRAKADLVEAWPLRSIWE